MLDLEVKRIAKRTWIIRWNADIGRTRQIRTAGVVVQEEWNRKRDMVEIRCYLCKRVNDCIHAFDVARQIKSTSSKT